MNEKRVCDFITCVIYRVYIITSNKYINHIITLSVIRLKTAGHITTKLSTLIVTPSCVCTSSRTTWVVVTG